MPEGAGKVIIGLAILLFVVAVLNGLIRVLANPSVGIPILLVLAGAIAAFVYYKRNRTRV